MSLKPSIVIKGWVYADEIPAYDPAAPGFRTYVLPHESTIPTFGVNVGQIEHRYESDATTWGVCVGQIEQRFTLPEGFDMKAESLRQRIASLEKMKDEAGREFAEKVSKINQQLAELQAIEG